MQQDGAIPTGRKNRRVVTTALTLLLILCRFQTSLGQSKKTILRLHGSNTIRAKLAPDLAEAFLKTMGADSRTKKLLIPGVQVDTEGNFSTENITWVIEIKAHGSSTW